MTGPNWLRSAWPFHRRAGAALLWLLVVAGIAFAVYAAGIHVVGSIDGWDRWLRAHSAHFLVWRLLVYAATAYGWWWMRKRLQQREPGPETDRRLLRIDIAAAVTFMLLEGSRWLRDG